MITTSYQRRMKLLELLVVFAVGLVDIGGSSGGNTNQWQIMASAEWLRMLRKTASDISK